MVKNAGYFCSHSRERYEYVSSATENYYSGSEYVGQNMLKSGAKENYSARDLCSSMHYIYIIVNAKKESEMQKVTIKKIEKSKLVSFETVSAKIRYLDSRNYSKSEIARILGKRYQHVRNVLITPLKRKN